MAIEKYKQTGPNYYIQPKKKYSAETKKWDELMLAAVEEDGLKDLLEGIKEHVRTHCLWLKEKEIEHYALSCLSNKSYEAWSNFSYQQSLF